MAPNENGPVGRQRTRQRRQRLNIATASFLLLGLVLGLMGGLYYAWLVAPRNAQTATAAQLSPAHQQDYIQMVSQAFAADGDWPRAEARLATLQRDDLAQTVLAQLEDALRQGAPVETVRDLAQVAERLGAQGSALALFAPTPVGGATPTAEAEPNAAVPTATPTLLPTPTTNAPLAASPTPTLTALPSPSPAPTRQPTYRLLDQQQVCQEYSAVPLIEVTVVDGLFTELAAVEVIVSWEGGVDRFLTGFKAGAGAGYGDFVMEEGVSYAVSLGGETAVGGLRADKCPTGSAWRGWDLRFQYLGE
ncbi:MAG: hypothetical protein IPL28_09380 [Chloroflexi bacterium]|nr:hypothetical protein [Chloroflexota bacterium]